METKANQLNMCTERSLKSHVLFLDLSVANCSSPSMTLLRRSSKLGTDVCIEVTSVASSFNALLISFSLADGPEMHSTSKHRSQPQCAGWRCPPLLNRDMTGKKGLGWAVMRTSEASEYRARGVCPAKCETELTKGGMGIPCLPQFWPYMPLQNSDSN